MEESSHVARRSAEHPIIAAEQPERYVPLHTWLKWRFGERAYKVSLDGGQGCPHRDELRGIGGCTFCADGAQAFLATEQSEGVLAQFEAGAALRKEGVLLAYFQSYTSTMGPAKALAQQWAAVLTHPRARGLVISSRPDCLSARVLDQIALLAERVPLWVELGLQSAHNSTLERINRGHTVEQFQTAVEQLEAYNLDTVAHLVFGLPGEDEEQMLDSVRYLAALPLAGIKIHPLHIVRGAAMAQVYEAGELQLQSKERYVATVADALRLLPPYFVVHRLTGEGVADAHIAPKWAIQKLKLIQAISNRLEALGAFQADQYRQHYADICAGSLQLWHD